MRKSIFLLAILSFSSIAETVYNYAGPFYVDGSRAHTGIVEMFVPRNQKVAVILEGDEVLKTERRNTAPVKVSTRTDDNKTLIISCSFDSKANGPELLHILTKSGKTYTISFIPAPDDADRSSLNVKMIIRPTA